MPAFRICVKISHKGNFNLLSDKYSMCHVEDEFVLMNSYRRLKATASLFTCTWGSLLRERVCERLAVCARVYMFAALSLWFGQCTLQSVIKHVWWKGSSSNHRGFPEELWPTSSCVRLRRKTHTSARAHTHGNTPSWGRSPVLCSGVWLQPSATGGTSQLQQTSLHEWLRNTRMTVASAMASTPK